VTTLLAIDKQVCFRKQLFADPVKPQKAKTDPVGPLRDINGVAWSPKLLY